MPNKPGLFNSKLFFSFWLGRGDLTSVYDIFLDLVTVVKIRSVKQEVGDRVTDMAMRGRSDLFKEKCEKEDTFIHEGMRCISRRWATNGAVSVPHG